MDKVSIIIPAYNEEKRIENTLRSYISFFDNLYDNGLIDYEIVVVINNTKDRTEEIVNKIILTNKKIRCLNFKQKGKGFAVIEGFKDALKRENDLIGFVDADASTSAEEYWRLISAMNGYGGVVADRYLKGSIIKPNPTLARLFAKRLFNFWARSILFIPFGDTQCGAKVFRRRVILESIPDLTMSQWAFDIELLYIINKKRYGILASPTKWTDKAYSTINFWQSGPWMALAIMRLRLIHSPFKGFVKIYDLATRIIRGRKI